MIEIIHGNTLDVLDDLPARSVHMAITSPPYFDMRDYGIEGVEWEDGWKGVLGNEPCVEQYVKHLVEFTHKVMRVLRDDGTFWLNLGDSHDRGRRLLVPERLAVALDREGYLVASKIVWAKSVSFCKSYVGSLAPQSVTKRPVHSYEDMFLITRSQKYFYDHFAVKEKGVFDMGTTAAKGSKERRDAKGVNARPDEYKVYDGSRNVRDVWLIPIERVPKKFSHFATYPTGLCKPAIQAGTSEFGVCDSCGSPYKRIIEPTEEYRKLLGKDWADYDKDIEEGRGHFEKKDGSKGRVHPTKRGVPSVSAAYVTAGWKKTCNCDTEMVRPATVLDPFAGLMSAGIASERLGRNFLGIELSDDYIANSFEYVAYKLGTKPEMKVFEFKDIKLREVFSDV